jgi:hypothetical protein
MDNRDTIKPPPDFIVDEHGPLGQCFPQGTWDEERNMIVITLGDGYDLEILPEDAEAFSKWLLNAADWVRLCHVAK